MFVVSLLKLILKQKCVVPLRCLCVARYRIIGVELLEYYGCIESDGIPNGDTRRETADL